MSLACVLVESQNAEDELRRLLPEKVLRNARIVVSDGRSAAISDARTILALENQPVALVLNAETDDMSAAEGVREQLRRLLQEAAADVRSEVFLVVPKPGSVASRGSTEAPASIIKALSDFIENRTQEPRMPVRSGRLTPSKRLALFFDGTWSTPETDTNVWRLNLMLADRGTDGVPQEKFYDPGVGTRWFDRLSGGAFGAGLSESVCNGYRWLMARYNPGDEIYVFGFSRGAFTARSLAGVIARCGLLKSNTFLSVRDLYERYQKGDTVRPIYRLKYLQSRGETSFDIKERLLLDYSYYQRNFIKMVGVWDTVGSIGLPFGDIPGISRRTLRFHNTNLSKIVQHSYQALALDEQRQPYWAVLWTNFVPAKPPDPDEGPQVDNRFVEQRWFAGSHCNVGGGYRNDLLPQRPLAWLQDKARACGLAFRSSALVNDDDLGISPRDSYAEFLGGYWKYLSLFRFGRRYLRWVKAEPVKKEAHWKGTSRIEDGFVKTVNERIDLSIFRRCRLYKDYRPPNLREWAGRKGFDLEKIIAHPEEYRETYAPVAHPEEYPQTYAPVAHPAGSVFADS